MNQEREEAFDPRIQGAIDELRRTIEHRYPSAQFAVARGHDDPENIHLITTVDLDDPDEVVDLVLERLIELEVEERIPLDVIPVRTPERILAEMKAQGDSKKATGRRISSVMGRNQLNR